MKRLELGLSAPQGFYTCGLKAGIKKSAKPDLMLLASKEPCLTLGLFSSNQLQASCVRYNLRLLKKQQNRAQALVANSGNANCLTGKRGDKDNEAMTKEAAAALKKHFCAIPASLILSASTGVIGECLPMRKIKRGIKDIGSQLSNTLDADRKAAQAILTTDRKIKMVAAELSLGGSRVRIGATAKGAGMIHPKMTPSGKRHATMLCFITTDALIQEQTAQKLFYDAVEETFNCVSIDADMSTNDMALFFANGQAQNPMIKAGTKEAAIFGDALRSICMELACAMIYDAEGATKFVSIEVTGAQSDEDAKKAALSVASSKLVKTALFGEDPNWGRIAASVGYSNAYVDPQKLQIYLGPYKVLHGYEGYQKNKKALQKLFTQKEIAIRIDLGLASGKNKVWTSDLSLEYVRFNSAYHT